LDGVDIGAAAAIELVLDDIEEPPVQPLHERQSFEIERTDVVETGFAIDWFNRLRNGGFHHDAFL
jgi:hypothetical protein